MSRDAVASSSSSPRARPRALFLSETSPVPPSSGARQRSSIVLEALRLVCDVHVVLVTTEQPTDAERTHIESRFGPLTVLSPTPAARAMPWTLGRWARPALADRVARAIDPRHPALVRDDALASALEREIARIRPDVVYCRYIQASFRAKAADASTRAGVRCVLDLDDVETQMLREWIADERVEAWRKRVFAARLSHLESRFARELAPFSALSVSSEGDVRTLPGRGEALVLPNIPYAPPESPIVPCPPPPASAREVLVVASWYYPPNIDGLDRFLDACWARVRTSVPDATLNIVGGSMKPECRERWSKFPGVTITGFAKDLREQYARCAIALAPVYYGGGTKIKVLEALAYGRACVVTDHAHRGYERLLPAGTCLASGSTDAALADELVRLLTKPEQRDAMAAAGLSAVREHFSFARVASVVARQVNIALGHEPDPTRSSSSPTPSTSTNGGTL